MTILYIILGITIYEFIGIYFLTKYLNEHEDVQCNLLALLFIMDCWLFILAYHFIENLVIACANQGD